MKPRRDFHKITSQQIAALKLFVASGRLSDGSFPGVLAEQMHKATRGSLLKRKLATVACEERGRVFYITRDGLTKLGIFEPLVIKLDDIALVYEEDGKSMTTPELHLAVEDKPLGIFDRSLCKVESEVFADSQMNVRYAKKTLNVCKKCLAEFDRFAFAREL